MLKFYNKANIKGEQKMSILKILISLLVIIISLSAGSAMAADYKLNPFTLTYEGAITENVKGKVNIHPVTYKLDGIDISANVYIPANYDPSHKYPAVVVAHPNGGVKEQVAGLYAQRLAEKGYITIAADAAYQEASGGQPRKWINQQTGLKIFMAWQILLPSMPVLILPV
jgi:predicted peptidase